jgi:predicted DNA-binding protein (MmcQ/YjbR family)
MFTLIKVEHMPTPITLRCDQDHALKLRAVYPAVIPGYV